MCEKSILFSQKGAVLQRLASLSLQYYKTYKICSKELLDSEVVNIKYISTKNGYSEDLIKRIIKSHHNNLNNSKVFGSEKFSVVLKLPYTGETSQVFEVRVKKLTKESYNQVSPRIIFLSKSLIKRQLKDLIPNQHKSSLVYKFNSFCDKSYIGQTSRHLKTRLKEHLPTCVVKFIEKEPKNMTTAIDNATKRTSSNL